MQASSVNLLGPTALCLGSEQGSVRERHRLTVKARAGRQFRTGKTVGSSHASSSV